MNIIPLSPYSLLFWNEFVRRPDSADYNISFSQKISGTFDIDRMERSFQYFLDDHFIFDSHISLLDGNPVWIRNQHRNKFIHVPDEKILDEYIKQPFDVLNDPLYRIIIQRLSENCIVITLVFHHLIIDGRTQKTLFDTLSGYYNGEPRVEPVTPEQIAQKVARAEEMVASLNTDDTLEHWREIKTRLPDTSILPFQSEEKRSPFTDNAVEDVRFSLPKCDYHNTRKLAQRPFIVFSQVWGTLLARCSAQQAVVLFYPIAVKPVSGLDMGGQVNSSLMLVDVQPDSTLRVMCQRENRFSLKKNAKGVYYNYLPTDSLVALSGCANLHFSFAQTPLRDYLLTFEGCQVEAVHDQYYDLASADLSLEYEETELTFNFRLRFRRALFDTVAIRRCGEYFLRLLKAAIQHPDTPLLSLPLLDNDEIRQLLERNVEPPQIFTTLAKSFEQQVALQADAVALSGSNHQLTYGELNHCANQLAHQIKNHGIQPGMPIALHCEKGSEFVIAMLAIIKAGGSYMPVDIAAPRSRKQYQLEQAKASLMISQTQFATENSELEASCNIMFCDVATLMALPTMDNIDLPCADLQTAAVFFTSGTTGNPKGVMITQQAIAGLVQKTNYIELGAQDTLMFLASPTFDAATFEVWGALLNGAKLVIPSTSQELISDPDTFKRLLVKEQISVLLVTRTLFDTLYLIDNHIFDSVRQVMVGGEALSVEIMQALVRQSPRPEKVLNLYGPTECTTVSCWYDIPADSEQKSIPIGRAISGRSLYVLNEQLQLQPDNAQGELYIGGQGVAKGYLGDNVLTESKFIVNPYADGYLYKSGDQVKRLADGNHVYIGRNDSQVKIRGYRIDLSEIEAALHHCEGIQQTAVLDVRGSENHYIVAWYVCKPRSQLTAETLRAFLQARLPEYMIPTFFHPLERIPVNTNGKLDRRVLLATTQDVAKQVTQTSTRWQTLVLEAWLTLLPVASVGLDDNFYSVGGDSVQAILLIAALRKRGYPLSLYDINQHLTVRKQAQLLQSRSEGADESGLSIVHKPMQGEIPLLPIQQWFFDQHFAQPHHWNQAFMLRIPENVATSRLQAAIDSIVQQHGILRTDFNRQIQYVHDTEQWPGVEIMELHPHSVSALHQQLTDLQSEFDLAQGPLWRAAVVREHPAGGDYLWFAFHHLIIDVVSWRILAQDIEHFLQHQVLPLPGSSYQQWAEALAGYAEAWPADVQWWKNYLTTLPDTIFNATELRQQRRMSLTVAQTQRLLGQANQVWNTEINDLLLSALAQALHAISGQHEHSIVLEGHGRESWQTNIDLSRTMGWFTSLYPVHLKVGTTLHETIINTKEGLRQIPAKGIGFGILRQQERLPDIALPAISFNYLGQLATDSDKPWMLSLANCGEWIHSSNTSSQLLNINGVVSNGALTFLIDSQLTNEQSEMFTLAFHNALTEIAQLAPHEGGKTASDYGIQPLSQAEVVRLEQRYPQMQSIHAATPLQQGMLFHALRSPDDDTYHVQQLIRYRCELDIPCYMQAWLLAIQIFPILRTAFDWQGEHILQIVIKGDTLNPGWLQVIDLSKLSAAEQQMKIYSLQQQDRQHCFDLSQPSPFRLSLFQCQPDDFYLLKSEHHAICDGWSMTLLLQQVHHFYDRLIQGNQPEVTVQQSWPQALDWLQRHQSVSTQFWQQQKQRFTAPNRLKVFAHPDKQPAQAPTAQQQLVLPSVEFVALKQRLVAHGYTLNTLLQFSWHKLIQIYTQETQTQAGVVVSGRDIPLGGIESCVGPFINTLPLTVDWATDHSCLQVLNAIHETVINFNSHSNVSLSALQEEGISLFESLVVCENYPQNRDQGGISSAWTLEAAFEKLDYPLVLLALESDNHLTMQLNYHTDWLSAAHASTLLNSVLKLMVNTMQDPTCAHQLLGLPGEEPGAPLLPPACTSSLTTRFAWCVQQYAQHTAVSCGELSLTYQQVEARASTLARKIIEQLGQVKPDTPIALLMDKGIDFVIGLLAIVKAGGCYVPLSVDYPVERIHWMLDDIATPLVLTQQAHLPILTQYNVLCMDNLTWQASHSIAVTVDNNSLGAIIYTSGTTGTPKGVLIEQAAMVELVVDNPALPLSADDNVLFLSSPVFDAATFEIWGALLNGGQLVIPESSTQDLASDTRAFKALLEQHQVSVMWVTRALFDNLWKRDNHLFDRLHYLLVGGEALTAEIMQQLVRQSPRPRHVLNGYGPTECTTFTTTAEIIAEDGYDVIPIGRAIAGRQLYILNAQLQPVPQGAVGELYVGGRGLARGYLNRDDLTAQQFIICPHITGRLYKTGDLVRRRADGQLEYLGRNDQQVKIRGYRVELQEIEAVLNQLPGVMQSVVLLQDTKENPHLCAWCVPDPSGPWSVQALFDALESRLPDYMLPTTIVPITEIPLTLNGKLARDRLPKNTTQREVHYQPPVTPLEQTIARIWQHLLKIDRISVTDNFFRIGGDSIQSILVTTALRKEGIPCTTRDIFNAKTIQQLAKILGNSTGIEMLSEQGVLTGRCPLLPVQQWFFELSLPQPHWFNQAFTLSLPHGIEPERLRANLHELIVHHDLLRTRYSFEQNSVQQYYNNVTDALPFTVFDTASGINGTELMKKLTEWQQDFCLTEGPLFRFVMLYNSQSSKAPALFCAFHHLIIDAVSWRILATDLQTLCEGNELENKGTSYRQWAEKLSEYASHAHQQLTYWQQMIAGQPDYHQKVACHQVRTERGLTLDLTQTRALLQKVHHAYKTEINELLLTPLVYALSDWHGEQTSFITLEGHGREALTPDVDLSHTVGWFTVMYPVKLTLAESPVATLRQVKDTLRQLPDKGLGYSALKYTTKENALRRHKLPAISFNYLGQFTTATSGENWQIDQAQCGEMIAPENHSSNVLDVVGRVTEGQLSLTFSATLSAEVLEQLVSKYHHQLQVLMDHCLTAQAAGESWFSPADFPHCAVTLQELDRLQQRYALEKLYPITPTQREQLYFNRINSDFQIDQGVVVIEGCFDPELMRASWQYAARRYDVFRTGYSDRACHGEPFAFVCQQALIPVTIEDWHDMPIPALQEALQQRLLQERLIPFDPEQPPLIRVVIIIAPDGKHYMLQTFNHVLIDGWSNNNIFTTLLKDYRALQAQQQIDIMPSSFEPFLHWLRNTDHQAAETFWAAYLAEAPMNQRLPKEILPPVQMQREKRMRKIQRQLPDLLTVALYRFANKTGYTVNQLMQLAWMKALAAHIPSDDIVIGTTMSERPAEIEHVDRLAGMFVASPVLRLRYIHSRSNEDLLADIASSQPDRQQHAFHELNHYDEHWRPTSPFGSLLVYESMPAPEIADDMPFTLKPFDATSGSNHQTVLCLLPDSQHFGFILFYDSGEVSDTTIQSVASRFVAELENICQNR